MDITRWSMVKLDWYVLCCQRWRSSTRSAKTRLAADCGSGPELLIAKFRLKLKKVGENSRPFRYDLVAQTVKNRPAMQETLVQSQGREDPWRRKWQPTPVFFRGESHGQRAWCTKVQGVAKSQTLRSDCHYYCEYIVVVTNRFKELDPIDRVPGELWTKVCNTSQETMLKTIPKKKKYKKAKPLSEEALQIAEERRVMGKEGR